MLFVSCLLFLLHTHATLPHTQGDPTYLVVNKEGQLENYGVNAVCTHLGCVVPWNAVRVEQGGTIAVRLCVFVLCTCVLYLCAQIGTVHPSCKITLLSSFTSLHTPHCTPLIASHHTGREQVHVPLPRLPV